MHIYINIMLNVPILQLNDLFASSQQQIEATKAKLGVLTDKYYQTRNVLSETTKQLVDTQNDAVEKAHLLEIHNETQKMLRAQAETVYFTVSICFCKTGIMTLRPCGFALASRSRRLPHCILSPIHFAPAFCLRNSSPSLQLSWDNSIRLRTFPGKIDNTPSCAGIVQ